MSERKTEQELLMEVNQQINFIKDRISYLENNKSFLSGFFIKVWSKRLLKWEQFKQKSLSL